jgi:hypothetical protein
MIESDNVAAVRHRVKLSHIPSQVSFIPSTESFTKSWIFGMNET